MPYETSCDIIEVAMQAADRLQHQAEFYDLDVDDEEGTLVAGNDHVG